MKTIYRICAKGASVVQAHLLFNKNHIKKPINIEARNRQKMWGGAGGVEASHANGGSGGRGCAPPEHYRFKLSGPWLGFSRVASSIMAAILPSSLNMPQGTWQWHWIACIVFVICLNPTLDRDSRGDCCAKCAETKINTGRSVDIGKARAVMTYGIQHDPHLVEI